MTIKANKEEWFSIELRVTDRNDPLVKEFLGKITEGMCGEDGFMHGIEVIACGWDPVAGAMTKCDAYEQFIEGERDLIDQSLESIVEEYLNDVGIRDIPE